MLFINILKKINPFKQKCTHILFCIPRNEGSFGPLPQFYALPIDDGGVLYYSDPEQGLGGLSQIEIIYWFKEKNKTPTLRFSGSPNTSEQFKEDFGSTLDKDYREFTLNEQTYFGFGNFGFCMGNIRLTGNPKSPFFDLF